MNSTDTVYNAPIRSIDFGWSKATNERIIEDLLVCGIVTVRDLVGFEREDFEALDHISEQEKSIVKNYLSGHGLCFGMRSEDFETWFSSIDPLHLSVREIAEQAFRAGQHSMSKADTRSPASAQHRHGHAQGRPQEPQSSSYGSYANDDIPYRVEGR